MNDEPVCHYINGMKLYTLEYVKELEAKLSDAYEAHKHEQEMRMALEAKLRVATDYLCRIENATDGHSVCVMSDVNELAREALAAINGGNVAAIDTMTKDDHENTLLDESNDNGEHPYAEHAEKIFKMSDKDFMKGIDK